MSERASTKGPWEVREYGDGDSLVVHAGDDWRICFMATPGSSPNAMDRIEANARLIAAAPDMFEALLTALPYIECAEEDDAYKPGVVANVTAQIRAALAKAGLTNLADANSSNPLSEGRERS